MTRIIKSDHVVRNVLGIAAVVLAIVLPIAFFASMWGIWLEGPRWGCALLDGVATVYTKNSEFISAVTMQGLGKKLGITNGPIRLVGNTYLEIGTSPHWQLNWSIGISKTPNTTAFDLPILLIIVLFLPAVIYPRVIALRARRRQCANQCAECGYQLTPAQLQCPECGAVIATSIDIS